VNRPFRFAVQARALGDPERAVAAGLLVEELGYEELYSYDHLGAVDPFVPLVAIARATTRLRVGPLVLNNELHHPGLLARTAATVDRYTGGRLVLGVGTGYAQAEHDALGIALRAPRERVDRLAECLAVLRSLLDTGSVRLDGAHHALDVTDLGVRPVGRVPLLVGGNGRRVVQLAARWADIVQFTGLTLGPGGALGTGGFPLAAARARARWLVEATGGDGTGPERSVLVQHTEVGPITPADRRTLADRFGLPEAGIDETPFVLAGTVAQIVDKLGRLRDELGISHVVVRDAEGFSPVVDALAGR
jgi:probable F420-dependent oxidoreductase